MGRLGGPRQAAAGTMLGDERLTFGIDAHGPRDLAHGRDEASLRGPGFVEVQTGDIDVCIDVDDVGMALIVVGSPACLWGRRSVESPRLL
jgi:hypothetical protein